MANLLLAVVPLSDAYFSGLNVLKVSYLKAVKNFEGCYSLFKFIIDKYYKGTPELWELAVMLFWQKFFLYLIIVSLLLCILVFPIALYLFLSQSFDI